MGKKIIKDYEFPLVTYLHHWGIESIEEYEELYNVYYNKYLKQVNGISNNLLLKILNKMDSITLDSYPNCYITDPRQGLVTTNKDMLSNECLNVLNRLPKKMRNRVLSLFIYYNSRHILDAYKRIFTNNKLFIYNGLNLGLIPYERMQNLLRYSCKDLSLGVLICSELDCYGLSRFNKHYNKEYSDIKLISYIYLDKLNDLTINFIKLYICTGKLNYYNHKIIHSFSYKFNLNEFINNCYRNNNYSDVYTALLLYLSESNKLYSNQLYKEGRTKTKKEKVIDVGINEDDLIVYPYYLDSYLKKKGESECASHTDIELRSYTSTKKSPHLRSGHVRHLSNGREVEVSSCVIHKDKYKKPFNVAYELK